MTDFNIGDLFDDSFVRPSQQIRDRLLQPKPKAPVVLHKVVSGVTWSGITALYVWGATACFTAGGGWIVLGIFCAFGVISCGTLALSNFGQAVIVGLS